MTTVTTLMPVFNGEAFVEEAVESVLGQRGVDVELIVIDDGSEDSTPEILAKYGDSIRVIRQENSGHVKARNMGATVARGDWLAFLDADDYWLPDKLAKQLALAGEDAGMVYTNRRNFGSIERVGNTATDAYPLWEGNLFQPLLFGNFVTVSSAIIRRDVFLELGGFDESLLVCEDWDLWLRFSEAGGVARVCQEPLTCYRWHASSMTNNQQRMCAGRVKVLERALATARGRSLDQRTVRRARASVWQCSAWYAAPCLPVTALRWYLRAAMYWPWERSVYKQMAKCALAIG
ncbi:MAG TPA: glycosyltransferase [Pirellulales bacterium]|nr:glycosyltransferase [Pirellulales bacterium]